MQVSVKDQQDTYRAYFPCEEHVGKSTVKKSQTIESLLPDEEDLFSGVLDELGCTGDDEDLDLFSSSGGMELEENSKLKFYQQNYAISEGLNSNQRSSEYLISCEHPPRTLVKNVDNKVEDSDYLISSLISTSLTTSISSGIVVNNCMNDGHIYGVHSPMASIYDQFGHGPHYSTNQAKLHNCNPSFHPQSVPISHGVFSDNDVIAYNSLNYSTVGFTTETNGKHLHMLNPYGPGIPYNTFQNHHLNPVIWSHSPPYDHSICAHSFPNLHGISEILPPLFTISPIHNQHVIGSPPSGNKDLQIACMEKSSKPDITLNPLQVVGFSSKVASPNSMMCSPQIKSHKSPDRNTERTLPFSFNRPRGRTRRVSHGRHETVSCHTDEKKYELDIERVLRGEDCRTTLMIKNIPNKYSSAMLLAAIDEHNQGTYDFIYLPLDFKNKCNMGYAFINMIDPLQIVQFHKSFNDKKWEKFHSGKVACLAYARIQGKAALIAHFQESSLMNEDKCCHPILFTTNGPNAGNQEPFPLGPNIHTRRQKNRCNARQINENQQILSTSCQIKN